MESSGRCRVWDPDSPDKLLRHSKEDRVRVVGKKVAAHARSGEGLGLSGSNPIGNGFVRAEIMGFICDF
jgi:hypothetical protein